MDPHALAVLLDPAAQPGPLAQQRLVRDLDRPGADRQHAAVGEQREHARDLLALLAFELVERDAPALDGPVRSEPDEAHDHAARDGLCRRRRAG